MKRVEVDCVFKLIIDIDDNKNVEDIVDSIEISEFDIDENASVIACNITNREIINFIIK